MITSLKLLRRSTRNGVAVLSSQVNPASIDPFYDLVNGLQNDATPLRPSPIEETKEFFLPDHLIEWVAKNKAVDQKQLLFLLRNTNMLVRAGELRNEESAKLVSSVQIKEIATSDLECVESMSLLVELGLSDSELYRSFLKQFLAADLAVPPKTLLTFIVAANKHDLLSPDVVVKLETALEKQSGSMNTAEVLTLFAQFKWTSPVFSNAILKQTLALLPVMSTEEVIAVMKYLNQRAMRNQILLKHIAQHVSQAQKTLSIPQIVTVAHACANLKFYDVRILRRISKDLAVEINHLNSWNEVTTLVESFRRIRLGDEEVWTCLANWCNSRLSEIEQKSIKAVAIVVNAFATMDVKNTVSVAEVLLKMLQRPNARDSVPSHDTWLQSVYSLAVCDVLTPELAETALNKDFVEHILKASRNDQERVLSARKLLQLQAVVVNKYGETYKGPRISRESFGQLLSSKDAVRHVLASKFGKAAKGSLDALLASGLHKLAPSSHIGPPAIDEMGFFHEATVSLDQNSKFIPVSAWTKETKVRPVVLIDWRQRKKSLDLAVGEPSEKELLGEEKLMLRILRAQKPLLVFMSDLNSYAIQNDKNNFLKSLLGSK